MTWGWYTIPMGTGGIAVVIARIPYSFDGLDTIGAVVFVANLAVFCIISVLLASFSFRPLWAVVSSH